MIFEAREGISGFIKKYKICFINVFLCMLLIITYFLNPFDSKNTSFGMFETVSENLALSNVVAARDDINTSSRKFGLFQIYTANAKSLYTNAYDIYNENAEWLSNNEYKNGLSLVNAGFAVIRNPYTESVFKVNNRIEFKNGERMKISSVKSDDIYLYIVLDGVGILKENIHGKIGDYKIIDSVGNYCPNYLIADYTSQVGLQGWIYYLFTKILSTSTMGILHLACDILLSIILVWICNEIRKRYNMLLAGCFYITFWLSQWIVNFASNLYWVEFTWFIPMLLGLICLNHLDNRRYLYPLFFLAVLIKSLCGYEYLPVIMLGSIMFIFIEWLITEDKAVKKRLFWTVGWIGMASIAAFITAILVHSWIRGDGNIVTGMKAIYRLDVLRRTFGNPEDFDPVYAASLEASVLDVIQKYFNFSTPIIMGVNGGFFTILALLPVLLLAFSKILLKAKIKFEGCLFIISFLTCISWFVLGKAHSYIHTHLNFVLWYFGFIQVCFYIIIKYIKLFFDAYIDNRISRFQNRIK